MTTFVFSESHITNYLFQGYTIFRGMLPASLIRDLRLVIERAREKDRDKMAYAIQPIEHYVDDLRPFQDYLELPALRDAVSKVLTPRHQIANLQNTCGLFVEPATARAREWHRDWRGEFPGIESSQWKAICNDIKFFNQYNCALYQDSCTWIVPGSHLAPNLPTAIDAVPFPQDPESLCEEGRELMCLGYCRAMPGAVQVHLDPGDFLMYRNTTWHTGNYVPYRKRATLFDMLDTPEYIAWRKATGKQWAGYEEEVPRNVMG
jgi:ectoine hydroxylase-related dioxygenase (phytanoyl-CoA dioxygenase family)